MLPPGIALPPGLREALTQGEDGQIADYLDVNGLGGYTYDQSGNWGRWDRPVIGYDEGGGQMLGAGTWSPYTATQDFAAATPGATLQDMKWWGSPNTAVSGSSAAKWISPSDAQPTIVRAPDGSLMMQLPGDAQSAGVVSGDGSDWMDAVIRGAATSAIGGGIFTGTGLAGYLNSTLGNVGGAAARGAITSGVLGGNPLMGAAMGGLNSMAGSAWDSFKTPSITESMQTLNTPTPQAVLGWSTGDFNGGGFGASGGINMFDDWLDNLDFADAGGYNYDPGGASNPFGPMEGGGNLFDYNYLPGGETQPFGPLPTGGNLYDFLPDNNTPSGPMPNGGNLDGGYGGLPSGLASQALKWLLGGGAAAGMGGSGGSGGGSGGGLWDSILRGLGGTASDPYSGLISKGIASAPILAAINYAQNQGSPDLSKLNAAYSNFDPAALTGAYDMATGSGRSQLAANLARRGVAGSSFGNSDLENYDMTRDVGRSALLGQGASQQANIASQILGAQTAAQKNKFDLYGRSLLALGSVFSPQKTSIF